MIKKAVVDYKKESLGPYDRKETYHGEGTIHLTSDKVEIVDHGLVVFEIECQDWVEIAEEISHARTD